MSTSSARDNVTWYLLTPESGCQPISDLHQVYPSMKDLKTPQEVLVVLRQMHSDAKLVPLVDVIEDERKRDGDPPTENELAFFKDFNRKNAFQITSELGRIELTLITRTLCKRLQPGSFDESK